MRARPNLFSDIAASLSSRRWFALGESDGVTFSLDEPVAGGVIRIRLRFDPRRLWLLPVATLEVVSGTPKAFVLHRYCGKFCFLDPNSVEWNPESPDFINHVVWVADRVVDELHRLQRGERIAPEDSEFVAHWVGFRSLLDIEDADWPPPPGAKLERLELRCPEFSRKDALNVYRLKGSRHSRRFESFGSVLAKDLVPVVVADLQRYPYRAETAWPPKTLAELNPWLISHNLGNQKKFWRSIADAIFSDHLHPTNVFMLINTLAGRFGALLVVDEEVIRRFRSGSALAKHLHGVNILTRSISIRRWTFERLDNDCILGRNAPEGRPLLAGKNIHLLGAGAVGAQLADLLVQAGAGVGGELHIFDPDIYRTENTGRHLLGVSALGLNKAEALVMHVKRQRLAENVFAHPIFAGDISHHHQADLVIDATSAPYLGAELSNAARRDRRWALLSAFVEGEGWIAGAYLYRSVAGDACRDCLEPWIGGKGSHIREQHQYRIRDNGCGSSFTPYRAAASTIAAALASELACDWISNKASPRYRTFRLPNAPSHVAQGRSSSPTSRSDCICSIDVARKDVPTDSPHANSS